MDRKEFGELLSALRQDMGWTQFQLAEYSSVDHAVISQIERGVKKYFEPELLFCLANALQFTTLERREFILAASGLNEKQSVRQPSVGMATDVFNPRKIVERMMTLTGQIRLPAFLVDVYSDVLAANHIMLAFYEVPSSIILTAAQIPGGYNTTRLNFGRDSLARTIVANNWDEYALNSMRSFREISLQYRAKPYFKYLMKAFRNPVEYPYFDRFWKLVSSTERDKEVNVDQFSYEHSKYGLLNYVASTTTGAVTSFGNLFLVQNLPLDQHTQDVFNQLQSEAGLGVVRFAPWPDKPMSR
jgi:transcriptional regulator with XRE-family HTH domain